MQNFTRYQPSDSAEKIAKAYNFRAKTTIAQAIEKQIDWYQKQKSETNKSEPNRKTINKTIEKEK